MSEMGFRADDRAIVRDGHDTASGDCERATAVVRRRVDDASAGHVHMAFAHDCPALAKSSISLSLTDQAVGEGERMESKVPQGMNVKDE